MALHLDDIDAERLMDLVAQLDAASERQPHEDALCDIKRAVRQITRLIASARVSALQPSRRAQMHAEAAR